MTLSLVEELPPDKSEVNNHVAPEENKMAGYEAA